MLLDIHGVFILKLIVFTLNTFTVTMQLKLLCVRKVQYSKFCMHVYMHDHDAVRQQVWR
jgi:hypothetical protein